MTKRIEYIRFPLIVVVTLRKGARDDVSGETDICCWVLLVTDDLDRPRSGHLGGARPVVLDDLDRGDGHASGRGHDVGTDDTEPMGETPHVGRKLND